MLAYLLFMLPAIGLALYAQMKLKSTYHEAGNIAAASGMTGAEAAAQILQASGIPNVGIERVQGHLSDHYDPRDKVLRLSNDIYSGRSVAALGIAAHEAGHALQDAQNYGPLVLRNTVVPLASFGSNMSWILLFGGMLLSNFGLILIGIFLYSLVVIFQVINLPVEYDASSRAKAILLQRGLISPQEQPIVARVLNAAALTYVAGTVTSILTLLYYLLQSGLLGGNRN